MTSLNAENISTGTLNTSRLPTDITVGGTVKATLFSGSGASVTSLNAENISNGVLALARGGLGMGTATGTTGTGKVVLDSNPQTSGIIYHQRAAVSGYARSDLLICNGWGGYYDMTGISMNAYSSGNNDFARYNNSRLGYSILTNTGGASLDFRTYGFGYTGTNIPAGVFRCPLSITGDAINTNDIKPDTTDIYNIGTSALRYNNIFAKSGVVSTSDSTEKISTPLQYGLDSLLDVSTIKFKWITQSNLPVDDPERDYEYYGVCADELDTIFPELIYNRARPYQLNYQELIPVCINAIKDLKNMITDRDVIIDQIKSDVAALKQAQTS